MTIVAVGEQRLARLDGAAGDAFTAKLRCLQRTLMQQVEQAGDRRSATQRIGKTIADFAATAAVCYVARDDDQRLTQLQWLYSASDAEPPGEFIETLLSAGATACRQGATYVAPLPATASVLVATPVPLPGRQSEAMVAAFSAASVSTGQLTLLMQAAAAHLMLFDLRGREQHAETDAHAAAALVELLAGIVDARDLDHACATAVGDLARLLNCRCAAVGLRRGGSGRCRLRAISGVASVDKRSETARLFEAALDEALLRGDTTVWPPQDDQQRLGLLAHKGLCTTEGAATIISVPLRGDDSDAIGGLVAVFDRADQSCTRAQALLHAAERPVATALDARQRLQPGRVARLFASTMGCWKSRRGRWTALAACLVVAAMAAPLPYKIACDCRVEPVARRFVAAPFDGRLDRALVKPGDVVRKGQVLAQMDGHEIRCELAGVEADRSRAAKQRDAAMAAHEYADAQIAGLQVQRCDLQLRVLNDRTQRLEVRSPVDGIVTTGDLQRVEGAALAVGQTLFEIAPLEEMVVEVDVSDDDVSHVVDGQVVHVRLDAYPTQTWLAPIDKLHPRSRIRDQQNVFVAEAMLNNADGRLRPGMKGRAKIVTPRRPLGWILLHKPWQWLTKTTTW